MTSNILPDELDEWFNKPVENDISTIDHCLPNNEQATNDTWCTNNNRSICIEEIIQKHPPQLLSCELIQYECSIAYFIQVLLETYAHFKTNKKIEIISTDKIKNIIQYLNWISETSGVLAKRINQPTIRASPQINLTRSSYNFCNEGTQCKCFYDIQINPTCKNHHYVHSLLKHDVDSLIKFLENKMMELTIADLQNVYLSIKTICFVSRHMAKEIGYVQYVTKNHAETFHRSNPFVVKEKKQISKRLFKKKTSPTTTKSVSNNRYANPYSILLDL